MLPHNICIAKSTLALTSQRATSVIVVKGKATNLLCASVKRVNKFNIVSKEFKIPMNTLLKNFHYGTIVLTIRKFENGMLF